MPRTCTPLLPYFCCTSASTGRKALLIGHCVPRKTTTTAFRSLKSAREITLPALSLREKLSTVRPTPDGSAAEIEETSSPPSSSVRKYISDLNKGCGETGGISSNILSETPRGFKRI